jgi:uncharacterized protein
MIAVMTNSESSPHAAGKVSSWVVELQRAIQGEGDAAVPCGSCTACCTSSQFIEIGPAEHAALRRIPRQLLFPAPRRPKGHMVMGFDARGHCPMLVNGVCSIYDDRPRTCRTYDCRVFAATGIDVAADAKPDIAARAATWTFDDPTEPEQVSLAAMVKAAQFLRTHRSAVGDDVVPSTATHTAVAAFVLHELFVAGVGDRERQPTADVVRSALLAERP